MEREIKKLGKDYLITFQGSRSCAGTAVMAVPYTKNGKVKATVSILNAPGKKDDRIACRYAARLCELSQQVVICTGGVHFDSLNTTQMESALKMVEKDLLRLEEQFFHQQITGLTKVILEEEEQAE